MNIRLLKYDLGSHVVEHCLGSNYWYLINKDSKKTSVYDTARKVETALVNKKIIHGVYTVTICNDTFKTIFFTISKKEAITSGMEIARENCQAGNSMKVFINRSMTNESIQKTLVKKSISGSFSYVSL